MNIGKSIRDIRKEYGITEKDLAENIGVSQNTISNLENNKTFPSKATIEKIANVLNVTPDYILIRSIDYTKIKLNINISI